MGNGLKHFGLSPERARRLARIANILFLVSVLFFAVMGQVAWADEAPPLGLTNLVYTASAKSLTMLFVTAVVLESAFAVIFNWRVFLAYFDTKGVKTIVMIVMSAIVVFSFNLDVFASLLGAFSVKDLGISDAAKATNLANEVATHTGVLSKAITTLVLAGGSSGVHNMMYALGFRSSRDTETTTKPAQDEAWVSVSVTCRTVDGPVQVSIAKLDVLPDGVTALSLAGSVRFRSPSLKELLMRNLDRFPQNGGYVVEPDKPYLIQAVADKRGDSANQTLSPPRYYKFAPRAVVDLDITI